MIDLDLHPASLRSVRPANAPLTRKLFIVALVAATSVFGWAVSRPLDWLLTVVPDDTFYYLELARHVVNSGAPSLDGEHVTNGFHPGWMLFSVACAAIYHEPLSLLRSVLVCAFALHVVSAWLVFRIGKTITTEARAWGAGALWLAHLVPFRLALQGMEGSFYVFALALALLVYLERIFRRAAPRTSDFVLLGLALSLCFWGRTDAMVLAIVTIVALLFSVPVGRWRAVVVMGPAFMAGIAPWFAWSEVATGSLFQRSGAMKLMWAAESVESLSQRVWSGFQYLFGTWVSLPIVGGLDAEAGGWRGALNAVVMLVILIRIGGDLRRPRTRDLATLGLALLAATLLTGCYYAFLSSDRQFWYKGQPAFLLFVVLLLLGRDLGSGSSRARTMVIAACALSVVALAWQVIALATYPWQRDLYYSQARFEAIVPEGETIGCFNAGIPAYFGRRRVVNLDGLVNNSIYEHYQARTVDRYLEDERIRYVADEADSWKRAARFMRRPPELTVLASAPFRRWGAGQRHLWRLTFTEAPR